jgi:hypothetical protein
MQVRSPIPSFRTSRKVLCYNAKIRLEGITSVSLSCGRSSFHTPARQPPVFRRSPHPLSIPRIIPQEPHKYDISQDNKTGSFVHHMQLLLAGM